MTLDVKLRGVTKRFGNAEVLRAITYAIPEGKFVTLLGPSGCGKTTFLRLIAGFIAPDLGDVVLGGEVITHLPPNRRQVGMVFQNYALFPHMTVEGNVSFGLRMRHLPAETIRSRVSEALDLVDLGELRDRYPHQLSGGQQQRVALARALAIQPKVLLLDEPFGALDRKLRLQMQVEVKKLIHRLGITTVFVTHDQEEALAMSDQVAVMNAGRIVQSGTPIEIYDNPLDPFVAEFVGDSNFIEGEFVRNADGSLALRHGPVLLRVANATGWQPGQRAVLVVRPEHLRLSAGAPSGESLSGVVSFVRPLGPMTEYEVETESGRPLKVTTPRTRTTEAFAIGERISVTLGAADACTLLVR